MNTGENHAWEMLEALDPTDVCLRTGAVFDADAPRYTIELYGHPVDISIPSRGITGHGAEVELLLGRLGYFSRISVLLYLVHARDLKPSGRLVQPADIQALDIYFKGSHALPLDRLASKYAQDSGAFLERGRRFGAQVASYGDASLMLHPFRRFPVTLILWLADEEFPARASLLFDSSCESQVPADVVWSIAMMSVLVLI